MSDIPPPTVVIPNLPADMWGEIFQRCDGVTLQNVRRVCRMWKQMVGMYEFVTNMSKRCLARGYYLFAHFGYSFSWTSALDWTMRMDAHTGDASEFSLPMLLNNDGWFEILGVENGIFCVRYCCLGSQRFLLTWNPYTGLFRTLQDPSELHDGEPAFLHAFAFYPNTLHYAILHVFYEDYERPDCILTIYTSFRRNWNVTITCPTYVHGLEPTYVTLDGTVYWISGSVEGLTPQAQYVVSFSIVTLEFRQIFVPEEATSHCHSILAKDGHIYVASNNHDDNTYTSVMWRIDQEDDEIRWVRLYEHRGEGSSYVPAVVADGAPIHVMERHIQVEYVEELHFTNFDICRYNAENDIQTSLQRLEYDGEVDMRSLHVYSRSVFPV